MKNSLIDSVTSIAFGLILISGLCAVSANALAQSDNMKATVTIVGDVDRFNIGQDGYCGKRTEVPSPAGMTFEIPAGKSTVFYIRSKFFTTDATYTCEGDFSFMPEPKLLHIIRYTFEGDTCKLEMYRSGPSETPSPMSFSGATQRNCLPR